MKFDEQCLSNACLKVNRKLSALTRLKKYLDLNKIKILFKRFFEAQFKYYPLMWMFYSRSTNRRNNLLHERALRLIYDDYELTFQELLQKDGSFTFYHYNIQTLCTELYKVYHNLSQTIFSGLFTRNSSSHNLCSKFDFVIRQVITVLIGSNSVWYYGPIIWSFVPEENRYVDSLEKFKNKIRRWKLNNYPCRICKNYIPNIEILFKYF